MDPLFTCRIKFGADLREDEQYFLDHPGATPITTAQVSQSTVSESVENCDRVKERTTVLMGKQGEELKKMVGAAVYIECSSKTQQVVPAASASEAMNILHACDIIRYRHLCIFTYIFLFHFSSLLECEGRL